MKLRRGQALSQLMYVINHMNLLTSHPLSGFNMSLLGLSAELILSITSHVRQVDVLNLSGVQASKVCYRA